MFLENYSNLTEFAFDGAFALKSKLWRISQKKLQSQNTNSFLKIVANFSQNPLIETCAKNLNQKMVTFSKQLLLFQNICYLLKIFVID